MGSWQQGAGGALSGAGAGAGIGSIFGPLGTGIGAGAGFLIGGLEGLFGGGDDPQADFLKQRQAAYDQLMQQYTTDPRVTEALQGLQQRATAQGLTDQERSMMSEALSRVNDQAMGQEGAIRNRALASGGGQGTGGLMSVLQQGAAQASSQRMNEAGVGALSSADQRRQQALHAYEEGAQRAQDAQNTYRLAASGQASGVGSTAAQLGMAQNTANQASLAQGLNSAGQMGMYLATKPSGVQTLPGEAPAGYHYASQDRTYNSAPPAPTADIGAEAPTAAEWARKQNRGPGYGDLGVDWGGY